MVLEAPVPHPSDLPSHAQGYLPPAGVEHDVNAIAQQWMSSFAKVAQTGDGALFQSLFVKNGYWRDILAFTNDYRSIRTVNIAKAASVSGLKPDALAMSMTEWLIVCLGVGSIPSSQASQHHPRPCCPCFRVSFPRHHLSLAAIPFRDQPRQSLWSDPTGMGRRCLEGLHVFYLARGDSRPPEEDRREPTARQSQ